MEQIIESESTYAAIVETEKELFQIISKKFLTNKDLEHAVATIIAVS